VTPLAVPVEHRESEIGDNIDIRTTRVAEWTALGRRVKRMRMV